MTVLGFKKWFETKNNKQAHSSTSNAFSVIAENIYKFPPRMLHVEVDVITENAIPSQSRNRVNRYVLNPNTDAYSEKETKIIDKIIAEGKKKGHTFYLLGYDVTSSDPKKCYKNSTKLVENFKKGFLSLAHLNSKGMGRMERIQEIYYSKIQTSLIKQRVELLECQFGLGEDSNDLEIPFYFNPNDYSLIEKYKGSLRGILVRAILENDSFEVKVGASKPWTSSKKKDLTEKLKAKEDLTQIFEMKYPNPKKSSLVNPQNKPEFTSEKTSIKELTQKRAESIVSYLQEISAGMPINFVAEGLGYKEGNPVVSLSIKKVQHL